MNISHFSELSSQYEIQNILLCSGGGGVICTKGSSINHVVFLTPLSPSWSLLQNKADVINGHLDNPPPQLSTWFMDDPRSRERQTD